MATSPSLPSFRSKPQESRRIPPNPAESAQIAFLQNVEILQKEGGAGGGRGVGGAVDVCVCVCQASQGSPGGGGGGGEEEGGVIVWASYVTSGGQLAPSGARPGSIGVATRAIFTLPPSLPSPLPDLTTRSPLPLLLVPSECVCVCVCLSSCVPLEEARFNSWIHTSLR